MGWFFNKKEKKPSREEILDKNAGVAFTTDIYHDDLLLSYLFRNVECSIVGDTSGLKRGAVLYMEEEGYLANCNSEIVATINSEMVLKKINDFFSEDKYCSMQARFVDIKDNSLICNCGFFTEKRKGQTVDINLDPAVSAKIEQDIKSIPNYEIARQKTDLTRSDIASVPELKIENITKSFDIDAKLLSFVVIDVETTGLDAEQDRIIQLSAIRYNNLRPVSVFDSLVNPKREIPKDASKINGIYYDNVKDAPELDEIANSFVEFVGNSPIVGYNIPFDLSFLFCSGINLIGKRKIYDAKVLAKKVYKRELQYYSLKNVLEHNGIIINGLHNSKVDCYATAMIFVKMIKKLTTF